MPLRHFGLIFIIFVSLVACSSTGQKGLAEGVWAGEASNKYATSPLDLELEQVETSLTGTATLADALQADLGGEVEGRQIVFSFRYNLGNESVILDTLYEFTGTIDENVMSGLFTVTVEGAGSENRTFKVSRKP